MLMKRLEIRFTSIVHISTIWEKLQTITKLVSKISINIWYSFLDKDYESFLKGETEFQPIEH